MYDGPLVKPLTFGTTSSNATEQEDGVRFGRTLITVSGAELLDHQAEAIVCPANRRGVMGVGIAGVIRQIGGDEIEREAMAMAPLTIGTAVSSGPGLLSDRGVKIIVHAVVFDALGAPTRQDIVRKATTAALELTDRHRGRSIVIPPLGSGLGPGRLPANVVSASMIEEIVAHLRRFTSRIERIILVQNDPSDVDDVLSAIREARKLFWGLRV